MSSLHDFGALGPIGPEAHGSRPCYQAGCRCVACRSAEACYRAQLRRRHLRHEPIAGAIVSAAPLWRQVKALRVEGFSEAEIARRLGLRTPRLQWHSRGVTLKIRLRLQRFFRSVMAEGPEAI